jgi:simple sugar transport system permease protein
MWLLNPRQFLTATNLQSMAFQLPELGLLSMAMMITMLTGGINLSIIVTANMAGIVTAIILKAPAFTGPQGAGPAVVAVAVAAGLGTAAVIGLINGALIAVLDVSPILCTLGMMTLADGLTIVVTRGYVRERNSGRCAVRHHSLSAGRTPLGFHIYMIGSNPTASYFSGVNNRAVLLRTYLISSLCAGIAALIMISRFNSAKSGPPTGSPPRHCPCGRIPRQRAEHSDAAVGGKRQASDERKIHLR